MNTLWYKNAVFYSLDVETFFDSNNDGIGDFQGLIQKLEYIAALGVNCIWLLPFYPSPNRDNGYDVIDYYSVDHRLGTLGDFTEFMNKANSYGIRVIIDLVVNHTSHLHPWFKEARKDKNSKYRHYYVWSDEPLAYEKEHLMLTGEEDTIWTYDDVAKQYYLHRFYKEQPDLNISNNDVQEEILKIMSFWLKLGVSGFRIDAAEMLIDPYGMNGADKDQLICFLDEMRYVLSLKKSDAILLAEVNALPEKMETFLHGKSRMHMVFNFYINQHTFLSLAREDATPLKEALNNLPSIETENQWLNFLRHHDELSLSLLSDEDRNIVFKHFAPDKNMQIYGRGIRRRLAPMIKNSQPRLELFHSLLFTLPGVPLIRYGDEIGMGDDLSLPGRESVRTPMQWSNTKNGGFSNADADALVYPVIDDDEFGYQQLNVLHSQRRPESFLNWIQRLITARKQCPEIGLGKMEILSTPHACLLAHSFELKNEKMLFIHNFSNKQIEISKRSIGIGDVNLYDVFGSEASTQERESLVIGAYGFQWLRVQPKSK